VTTAERPTERPPANRTPIHPLTDRSPATPPGHDHIKIKEAYRLKKAGTEQQLVDSDITYQRELERRGRESGRAATMSAVRDLTGVPIDHFAEINLAGFYDLTDALGGVEVCLNQPVSDDYSGADFPRRDVRRSTMPGAGCAPQEAANEGVGRIRVTIGANYTPPTRRSDPAADRTEPTAEAVTTDTPDQGKPLAGNGIPCVD
jgi:hypothetical protein